MKILKDYVNDIKDINKKDAFDYRYKYYELHGDTLKLSKKCEVFGNDREGFEKFKSENNDSYVGPSGKISLREIKDSVSQRTIGYVTEEKVPGAGNISEAEKIYEELFNKVKSVLNVEDNEAFMFYILQGSPSFDFRPTIDEYIHKARWLVDLYNNYKNDEEFRHFLDKIIKN